MLAIIIRPARESWQGLFEGLAAGCGRHIRVTMSAAAGGRPPFVWSIG